jgi:hypothetical protein
VAITALYENSASISTTEYSLTNNSTSIAAKTDDGVFQTFLDLSAMVAGDEYELKVYEKVTSGGTQRVVYRTYFLGVQSEPHCVLPSLVLMHGWDVTLDRLAGSDRTIAWSIRQVA